MNEELSQLDPDQAAASLAFATQLEEGLLPIQEGDDMEETEEVPQEQPEQPEPTLREQYPAEEDEGLMEVKEEIAALREEIQKVLSEESEEEDEKPEA